MTDLEPALQTVERDLEGALRSAAATLKELKRARSAAALGHLRDLRQALDLAVVLAEASKAAVADVCGRWTFDDAQHFASGAYTRELLAAAKAEGVAAFESDGRILSYPAIVSVSATDPVVSIDRQKERRVRPSLLARRLKALQARPPRFKPEPFLDALAEAHDLVRSRSRHSGAPVRLVDVYAVLTMMPGAAREYTKQEFARDLYLLDESGLAATRSGRGLSWPASATTRGGGVLTTVTRKGQEKVYVCIQFAEAQ